MFGIAVCHKLHHLYLHGVAIDSLQYFFELWLEIVDQLTTHLRVPHLRLTGLTNHLNTALQSLLQTLTPISNNLNLILNILHILEIPPKLTHLKFKPSKLIIHIIPYLLILKRTAFQNRHNHLICIFHVLDCRGQACLLDLFLEL